MADSNLWFVSIWSGASLASSRFSRTVTHYGLVWFLVKLLPGGWTNQAQTFRVSSGHGRERIFVKSAWLFKKPETFISKILGNPGCSPFQQAEFDLSGAMLLRRRRHLGEFRLAQQSARPQLRPLCSERVQTRSQLPGSLLARAWYWRNAAHLLNFDVL